MKLINQIALCLFLLPGLAFTEVHKDEIRSEKSRRGVIACIARNWRGEGFLGRALIQPGPGGIRRSLWFARNRAMRKCWYYSYQPRACYVVGCRRIRLIK